MILTIRTDQPEAEIGLYDNTEQIAYERWPAHRQLAETIHAKVHDILEQNRLTLQAISGIVVFRGPGSFTGLRIGIAVANALAVALEIPIVGAQGTEWIADGLTNLEQSQNDKIVVPEYGAEARTTIQKK